MSHSCMFLSFLEVVFLVVVIFYPFCRKTYKCKPRVRLFAEPSSSAALKFDKKMPLSGLHFLLDRGTFPGCVEQRDLATTIRKLGGSLLSSVSYSSVQWLDCVSVFEGITFLLFRKRYQMGGYS